MDAESFCLDDGAGGDGGLHPGPCSLLPLLPSLHQICQGETEVLRNPRLFIRKDVVNEHFHTKNTLI